MSFGFTSVDQGNVYRTLRQLEKDNLITSQWDTSAEGPARRIYSLTDAGEQYLSMWANSLEQYQNMLDSFFTCIPTCCSLLALLLLKSQKNQKRKKTIKGIHAVHLRFLI